MRIQHNILAMNSYRNYTNNASALGKNLEKLSSGYKINRAGDDAAGLAISEKMRAQIKGLDAAQKNVKDGISLVKTAEGAMQEIQDMLSRMKYLATQSSNGTYDEEVDRAALQDEVDQLRDEINRIADSANFNGTKLLDGSLSTEKGTASLANFSTSLATDEIAAVAGKYDLTVAANKTVAKGDVLTYNIGIDKGAGKGVTVEISFNSDCSKAIYNGKTFTLATAKTLTKTEAATILADAVKDTLSNDFTITRTDNKITFEAKVAGTNSPTIGAAKLYKQTQGGTVSTFAAASLTSTNSTKAADAKLQFSNNQIKVCTNAAKIADSIFTINGKRIAVVKDGATAKQIEDKNLHVIVASTNKKDVIGEELSRLTGFTVTAGTNYSVSVGAGTTGSAMQLQIGDTSDKYNQLHVSVKDMHTTAMGVANIDISTIDGAASAINVVKDAVNYVSSVRGTLGAIQNRLEHTANNLSVMHENIQDAESTIRDTDVADEMMAYTKNNILIQSAQAMLAQANAVPQGVLQLLQ